MIFRATVRKKAKDLLTAAFTGGGATVTSSKDTPVPTGKTPSVTVYTDDKKQTLSKGSTAPEFRTTVLTTVEMVAEGKTKDEAEALIDTICETAENTLLGSPDFVKLFEVILSVETRCDYHGDGARLHTFVAVMEIQAYATETFQPAITTNLAGLNIYVDSVNVADLAGTYTPAFPYAVTPAPRSTGPDGRTEISASVAIPTE